MPRIVKVSNRMRQRVGALSAAGTIDYHEEVASEGQTEVTFPWTYEIGSKSLFVFVNGIRRRPGEENDYVELSENQIKFNTPLVAGDLICVDHIKT